MILLGKTLYTVVVYLQKYVSVEALNQLDYATW